MFKYFTRGGQILFHNFRMWRQVALKLFRFYLLSLLMLFAALVYFNSDTYNFSAWYALKKIEVHHWFSKKEVTGIKLKAFYQGKEIQREYTSTQIENNRALKNYLETSSNKFTKGLLWAFFLPFGIITPLFLWMIGLVMRRTKDKYEAEHLIRGSTVGSPKLVNKRLKSEQRRSDLQLAGLYLVKDAEVKHFLMHGTTGVGKTQVIRHLLKQVRARQEKAIILDDGGAYAAEFYDASKGDIILNPFDMRCPNWDAWAECDTEADFENFATALIPDESDKDKFWVNSARNILSSIMRQLKETGNSNYQALLKFCLNFPLDKLQAMLKDTPAEQLVDGDIAKTATTIRAVMTNHVKSLRYLPQEKDKPTFSFKSWLQNADKHQGACVFIVVRDKDMQAIQSLISLWVGIVTTHVKSLERSRSRRIWLMLDEVMNLNRLHNLSKTLATGRNYGLCCVLGIQNKAQLRETYGRDGAQAIFDLLSTQLFFRSTSGEIADEVSRELGESEVIERVENYSYGAESVRDGVSINQNKRIKRVVSYTQIQNLNDLECYIKLPANLPRVKLKLPQPKTDIRHHQPFVERDITVDENVESKIKQVTEAVSSGVNADAVVASVVESEDAEEKKSAPKKTKTKTRKAKTTTKKKTNKEEKPKTTRKTKKTSQSLTKKDQEKKELVTLKSTTSSPEKEL